MASQDNEYPGRDVLDTIPLYECYWQLAEIVDHTQRLLTTADRERDDLLPRICPVDQLEAARTDHRKKAVARDTLTLAFRYLNLQLWVRPLGKADIPLASDAILELDKNSFDLGAYIPLDDDQSWLSRRPLFIKEVDWNAFVDTFRRKTVEELIQIAPVGRPNFSNEAIAIYDERLSKGHCHSRPGAEAKIIWGILAERYQDDQTWTYKLASLVKALSDHRRDLRSQ